MLHDPIKSLNWPTMIMAFGVKDKAMLDKLAQVFGAGSPPRPGASDWSPDVRKVRAETIANARNR